MNSENFSLSLEDVRKLAIRDDEDNDWKLLQVAIVERLEHLIHLTETEMRVKYSGGALEMFGLEDIQW